WREADALRGRVEGFLLELERGRRTLPPGVDAKGFWRLVLSDGKLDAEPELRKALSLAALFKWDEDTLPQGSMEENSRDTNRLHCKHLKRILGENRDVHTVSADDLQRYINRRAKQEYRGAATSAETIRKELRTLSAIWNRAARSGLLSHPISLRGLKYPKRQEKPPFQTWREIETRIAKDGLNTNEAKELWRRVFLDRGEIAKLLEHVKGRAYHPF